MPTRCYAKVYWKYKYVVSLLGTSALYVPCLSNLKGEVELDWIVETLNGKHEAVSFSFPICDTSYVYNLT